ATADQHVRQIPDRDQALLPGDLLADEGGVLLVDLRLAVESPEPCKSRRRVAGLLQPARDDEAEHGAHRPAGERVTDDQLAFPLGIEEVIPILRRLRRRYDLLGIEKDGRCLVYRHIAIVGAPASRRDRGGPPRSPAVEQ